MKSERRKHRQRNGAKGFNLTELVVTMAVGLVLIGIGMPATFRAYHLSTDERGFATGGHIAIYADEMIERNVNTAENCVPKPDAGDRTITDALADPNGNGPPDHRKR